MSQQINTDIQLRVGAEDLACLGYQDPKLVLGELGGFAIVNESGQNKRTVLFNDTIHTAWTQLLAELTSRFPDLQIPDILQTPRFFPVSADKQHGIFLRPDGIEFTGGWADLFRNVANEEGNVPEGYICVSKDRVLTKGYFVYGGYEGRWTIDNEKHTATCNQGNFTIWKDAARTQSSGVSLDAPFTIYGVTGIEGTSLHSEDVYNDKAFNDTNFVLYTLDCEPIFIPFEQPLDSHLTLHDASDYDVWLPLAEDGTEMYEYLPDYEGCKVYHWNRTWVKAVGHQPCPLETFLHGWTERLNAAFFRNLEKRISALESKLE